MTVDVDDEGPGVPAGAEDRGFEKFYRAAQARTATGTPGSGLGLAICRAIVEAHGGTIHASSRPGGNGARFRIRLLVGAPAPPLPAPIVDLP